MGTPALATRRGLPAPARVPLLALGFIALFAGVAAGLARLGVEVPQAAASLAMQHGPLMIGGFFGVVIALERAVALGRAWAYAGPLLGGIGAVCAIAGAPRFAPWLLLAASVVLLAATADVFRRQRAMFTFTLVLGALAWVGGNALWATGAQVHDVVAWWLAFLILTIAGERLELSRLLPPSKLAQRMFAAIVTVIGVALVAGRAPWGSAAFAVALLALAAWLAKQDIARRTVRGRGLTRYIAICLLSGYGWLAIGGAIALAGGLAPGTRAYDAALHALAVGFVFSMVFGHAPIIFPAVLRVDVPYRPWLYVPLVLLHVTLAVRVAGDATGDFGWTRAGGIGNAIALAAFIVSIVSAVVTTRRKPPDAASRAQC